MRFLSREPIRRQLVAVTVLLLASLAAAIAWSANRTRLERQSEVRSEAALVAATAAAYLNQYLDGIDSIAALLTRQREVTELNGPACDRLFAHVLREQPLLLNILLTDVNGVPTASPAATGSEELTDHPYVRQVVSTGRPVVGELTTTRIGGKPTVVFAYPVRGDGAASVGVIALAINLARHQDVFASLPLPEGSVVTVTDGSGRVLARSREAEKYIGRSASNAERAATAASALAPHAGLDGIERFYGAAAVGHGAWALTVGIPRRVVLDRVTPLWRRNIAIVASAAGVLLTLGLLTAWQTTVHLNRLRSAAQRIADGDLSPPHRTPTPNREFAQLQDVFITMAVNLRDTRDALNRQMEQERKMNDMLHSLERQVVRQERLAAVGVLVSGVAHELNNPLQAILGTLELLERHPGISPAALEEISFVKTQSGRAREIIRNLSRFSSQQSGPPSLVDLRDVIAEVVQLRRRDLNIATIALDVEPRSQRKVYANFTELEQVTLNFVINAQQSIEGTGRQGRILIRLFDVGKRVRLEVLDNGQGVKPEDEPKLFQPFFTTKPVGKGTGLGLSVSYGIIDSYGGAIGHCGNEWGGATFYFELPAGEAGNGGFDDRPAVLHRSV